MNGRLGAVRGGDSLSSTRRRDYACAAPFWRERSRAPASTRFGTSFGENHVFLVRIWRSVPACNETSDKHTEYTVLARSSVETLSPAMVFSEFYRSLYYVHPPSSRDAEHPAKFPTSKGLTDFRVAILLFGGPRNSLDCGVEEEGYFSTCQRKYCKSAEFTSITVRQSGVIFVPLNMQVIPCGTNSKG